MQYAAKIRIPIHCYFAAIYCWCAIATAGPLCAAEVLFERDVMAVLSKAGCNQGICHGNLNGKGGLHLSLRGQSPDDDYLALTHEFSGRRINRVAPAKSLMLLKATAQVPHQGGQRFKLDSPEYQTLLNWIQAGLPVPTTTSPTLLRLEVTPMRKFIFAPAHAIQLNVQAVFSDGVIIDVTRMATYESSSLDTTISAAGNVQQSSHGETTIAVRYLNQQQSVRLAFLPNQHDFKSTAPDPINFIDEHVFKKLEELQINLGERVSDHIFLRRVYFDLLGIPPTAEQSQAFAQNQNPQKRNLLIDQLLIRPEFADQWALKWSDLLRNEEKVMDQHGVQVFHNWIRQCFADGLPLDQFASQLIASTGSTYDNPPANYYRPLRDPLTRGETTARLFLGVRLECAKCHNHPFDRWTQDDYYSWASVFARVDYELVENKRRDKLDKNEFNGEQRIITNPTGEVTNAKTGEAAEPRFLGVSQIALDTTQNRCEQLSSWLTDPSNDAFSKAQVNRIWYHLMGRGLVNPVDDFRITNPASHPGLLNTLAADFTRHEYDIRHLLRTILNSHTYQVSSSGGLMSELAEHNYARMSVRRLTAEQLLDAQCQALQTASNFNGYDAGTRAGQLPGVQRVRLREKTPSNDDRFLTVFGKPARIMACECERSSETTLSQAFLLISGDGLNLRLTHSTYLQQLANSDMGDASLVERLYWATLSRSPTSEESQQCISQLTHAANRTLATQDLAWALLNSKEFMFRQ
ncbi:MAG: DUF1549 and DUF1553 domain-containing protein [Pirellulaceae bacterium]|nr:DUF1549 and DUF1553 domain-containing protein [Pirellulaceae bacterium]